MVESAYYGHRKGDQLQRQTVPSSANVTVLARGHQPRLARHRPRAPARRRGPPRGAELPGPVLVTDQQPLFSFLCTAYKTEQYLPATINSVLAQTRADWELVVVDNGMSDEIAAIVLGYDDPRIRLVRQENRGAAGGVDAAAESATGRYLSVLDSDDQLMPEYCARTAAVFERHPGADVVGIDAFVFDERDGDERDGQDQIRSYRQYVGITTPADPEHAVTLVEVIRGELIYYTAAIRAEAWWKGGGYTCDTPRVGELALYIRLLVAGCEIRVLDDRLARYRLRSNSFSRDPAEVEAFENQSEQCLVRAAAQSVDPRMPQALDVALRRLRFNQAMRKARAALLKGDTRGRAAKAQATKLAKTGRQSQLRVEKAKLNALSFRPNWIRPRRRSHQPNLSLRTNSLCRAT